MSKESVAILRSARDLVEQGWIKGSYSRTNPVTGAESYCMVGAINKSAHSPGGFLDFVNFEVQEAVLKVLPDENRFAISSFNDAPETTLEDVLLVFKKAIYEEENGG